MEKGAVLLYTQSSLIWVLPTNCEILDARDCVSSLSLSLSLALHSPWHKVDVKYLLEEEMRRRKETGQKGRRKEGERDLCGQMHSRRYNIDVETDGMHMPRDAYAHHCRVCAGRALVQESRGLSPYHEAAADWLCDLEEATLPSELQMSPL